MYTHNENIVSYIFIPKRTGAYKKMDGQKKMMDNMDCLISPLRLCAFVWVIFVNVREMLINKKKPSPRYVETYAGDGKI
jgi:hypothetical protein